MKKKLVFLFTMLVVTMLMAVGAMAADYPSDEDDDIVASGSCGAEGDNVTYSLDSDGVLTISGMGEMKDYSYYSVPWYAKRGDVKKVVINDGVTSIGNYAFYSCESSTSIEIPASVTSIGNYAFSYCSSLTSIEIPTSVTSIGYYAFSYCKSLTSIEIPTGVTSIRFYMFSCCESLTSIEIPASVTSIDDHAFYYCENLTSITIPDSVTSIEEYAFYGCESLTDVYYSGTSDDWAEITIDTENGCFTGATIHYMDYAGKIASAKSVVETALVGFVSTNDTTAGDIKSAIETAIASYEGVTVSISNFSRINATEEAAGSITATATLTLGGESADVDVVLTIAQLEKSYIAKGTCGDNVNWVLGLDGTLVISGEGAIADYIYNGNPKVPWNEHKDKILSVVIQDGITAIGMGVFEDCVNLSEISLPASITIIDTSVFKNCISLKDVYYNGTAREWAEVADDSYSSGNGTLLLSIFHFTEEDWLAAGMSGDSIIWTLDKEGTITFFGKGELVGGSTASWYLNCVEDIKKIIIEDGITEIGYNAFSHDGGGTKYYTNLKTIVMADSVTLIDDDAFEDCPALENITFSKNLTYIGSHVFEYATSLKNVTMPESQVEVILGSGVFYGCSSLETVSLGTNVNFNYSMGIFHDTYLKDIYFRGTKTEWEDTVAKLSSSDKEIFRKATVRFMEDSQFLAGGYCGDYLTWTVDDVNGLVLNGYGTMYDYNQTTLPWKDYTEYIHRVIFPNGGIRYIGDYAFYKCSELKDIYIPNNVVEIGDYAFAGCTSLSNVEIPSKVANIRERAFSACSGLTSMTISNSVANIGKYAFESCNRLKDIYYDGTTNEWSKITIENGNGCLTDATIHCAGDVAVIAEAKGVAETALVGFVASNETTADDIKSAIETAIASYEGVTVSVSDFVKTDATEESTGSITAKATLTLGGESAAVDVVLTIAQLEKTYIAKGECGADGDNLTWILDEEGTLTISGTGAMKDYEADDCGVVGSDYNLLVKNIVVENGVTTIGNYAFYNHLTKLPDKGVEEVCLPDTITSIGEGAFRLCHNLTAVTIPKNVASIGVGAFNSCKNLTVITVASDNTVYDSRSNCNAIIETSTNTLIAGCKTTVIPSGVKVIGPHAFDTCTIESIIIPESVTSIGEYAFYNCDNLLEITIPKSIKNIERGAFNDCGYLASVTIPTDSELNSIGYSAFGYCYKLESIFIPSKVTSIGDNAFMSCKSLDAIVVDSRNTTYDSRDNCNAIIKTSSDCIYYGSNKTVIPESVVSIYKFAFANLDSLTSINIPKDFVWFYDYAFYGCNALKDIYVYGESPAALLEEPTKQTVFPLNEGLKIYIPAKAYDVYMESYQWSNYKDYFVAVEDDGEIVAAAKTTVEEAISGILATNDTTSDDIKSAIETAIASYEGVTVSISNFSKTDATEEATGSITAKATLTLGGESATVDVVLTIAKLIDPNRVVVDSAKTYVANVQQTVVTNDATAETIKTIVEEALVYLSGEYDAEIVANVTDFVKKDATEEAKGSVNANVTLTVNGRVYDKDVMPVTFVIKQLEKTYIAKGTCGTGVNWVLGKNGTLTISGEGEMKYCTPGANGAEEIPWRSYKSSILNAVIEEGVTTIEDYAFYGCTKLTGVTIPDSVTRIGMCAFDGCTGLTSIDIPESVKVLHAYAFQNCSSLSSVTLREGLETISSRAFSRCASLDNVVIPDSVTSMGDEVFYECTALSNITLGKGITSIGKSTFYGCSKIASVVIPDSVKYIGEEAFYNCDGITTIIIPDEVTSIARYAFNGCDNLRSVILGSKVETIGTYAFMACKNLDSITIPASVTKVGNNAFRGCDSLSSMSVSKGNTVYDSRNGCNAIIETVTNTIVSGCKDTVIPDTVTAIGEGAFSLLKSLKTIEIPDSVRTIGSSAFSQSGLTSVVLPESIVTIGEDAFYYNLSLKKVVIGSGVTEIGDASFYGGMSLYIHYAGTEQEWSAINGGEGVDDRGVSGILYKNYKGELETAKGLVEEAFDGVTVNDDIDSDSLIAMVEDVLVGYADITVEVADLVKTNATTNKEGSVTADVILRYFSEKETINVSLLTKKLPDPNRVVVDDAKLLIGEMQNNKMTGDSTAKTVKTSVENALSSIEEEYGVDITVYVSNFTKNDATIDAEGSVSAYITLEVDGKEYSSDIIFVEFVIEKLEDPYKKVVDSAKTYVVEAQTNTLTNDATTDTVKAIIETAVSSLETAHGVDITVGVSDFVKTDATEEAAGSVSANITLTIGERVYDKDVMPVEFVIPQLEKPFIAEGECGAQGDNITWVLGNDNVLTISGTGEMKDYLGFDMPWYSYRTTITGVVIEDGVTSIGDYAFYSCKALQSINVPDGVTSIGEYAFAECESLDNVELTDDVTEIGSYAFSGCSGINSIIVPLDVEVIKENTFSGCTNLEKVTMSEVTTQIEDNAFEGCENLKDVYYVGQRDSWTEISVGSGNDKLLGAVIHCDDDKDTLANAKGTAETALVGFVSSNGTTADDIKSVIETAIASYDGVTVSIGNFSKIDATEEAAGSITAKATLTLGGDSSTVNVVLTIAEIADPYRAVIDSIKTKVVTAQGENILTNDAVAGDIEGIIENILVAVKAEYDIEDVETYVSVTDFVKTDATVEATGSVNAKITLTIGGKVYDGSDVMPVTFVIPKLERNYVTNGTTSVDKTVVVDKGGDTGDFGAPSLIIEAEEDTYFKKGGSFNLVLEGAEWAVGVMDTGDNWTNGELDFILIDEATLNVKLAKDMQKVNVYLDAIVTGEEAKVTVEPVDILEECTFVFATGLPLRDYVSKSDNHVTQIVVVKLGGETENYGIPKLVISACEEDGYFKKGSSLVLTLNGSQWSIDKSDTEDYAVGDVWEDETLEYNLVSDNKLAITLLEDTQEMRIALDATVTGEEATVTIEPMDVATAETFVFAVGVEARVTVTSKGTVLIDEDESGFEIRDIILTENVANAFEDGEVIKLRLYGNFVFDTASEPECISSSDDIELDFVPFGTDGSTENMLCFTVNRVNAKESAKLRLTGIEIKPDGAEIDDLAEITVSGDCVEKTTLQVAQMVEYGINFTADKDEVPVFAPGSSGKDTLMVNFSEKIPGSWHTDEETILTLPEGITIEDVLFKGDVLTKDVTWSGNVVTIPAETYEDDEAAKWKATFTVQVSSDFEGDITCTLGGAAVEEEATVVIAKVSDYGITFIAEDAELPVIAEMDVGDTLKVIFEENTEDSWWYVRNTTLTLPEGITISNVEFEDVVNGEVVVKEINGNVVEIGAQKVSGRMKWEAKFRVEAEKGFIGDVTCTLGGSAVEEEITVVIAEVVEYGINFRAEKDDMPELEAGTSGNETLAVRFAEKVAGSWWYPRRTTLTFPEGITIEDVIFSNLKNNTEPYVTINGNVVELGGQNVTGRAEWTAQFVVSVDDEFAGDVTCTLGGPAVEEEKTVVVAEVKPSFYISKQPADVFETDGSARLSVTVEGDADTYKWQYRTSVKGEWKNISTDRYYITVPVKAERNGYQYRCTVTSEDGETVTSRIVTIYYKEIVEGVVDRIDASGERIKVDGVYYDLEDVDKIILDGRKLKELEDLEDEFDDMANGYEMYVELGLKNDEVGEIVAEIREEASEPVKITKQPEDIVATEEMKATISVEAEGEDLTYLWERSKDGGKNWTATTVTRNSISVTVKASIDGWQYRCVITDADGNKLVSEPAEITFISGGPEITKQPEDIVATEEMKATISVQAEGAGLTYLWERSKDGGNSWTATTVSRNNISVTVKASISGWQYRCVITDADGNKVISEPAEITFISGPEITKQPEDIVATEEMKATISVEAEGVGLTYLWERSKDGGNSWTATTVSRNNISVTVKASIDGWQYRCVITDADGNKVISEPAEITFISGPEITKQPEDIVATEEMKATISVEAEGVGLTYLWERSKDGGDSWTATTVTRNSISVTVKASIDGWQYRCVITDADGNKLVSKPAEITFISGPEITKQPEDVYGTEGTKATISVEAEGEGLTYLWVRSKDGGNSWTATTVTRNNISVTVKASIDGWQYRCVITDADGKEVISDAAKVVFEG